jgi:hypothetical protein
VKSLYQLGDKVSYVGVKYAGDIGGKMGEIVARVQNAPEEFVVDFGSDTLIVGEKHITKFQGHLKPNPEHQEEKKAKGPKVEQRRGKRQDEEAE